MLHPIVCTAQSAGSMAAVTDLSGALPQAARDALKLTDAGMGEEIILHQLRHAAAIDLTSDEIVFLAKHGVSQNVIKALLNGGQVNGSPAAPNVTSEAPPNPEPKSGLSTAALQPTQAPQAAAASSVAIGVREVATSSDATMNEEYQGMEPFLSGVWKAELMPGYDGSPRYLETSRIRDMKSGAITIESKVVSKGQATVDSHGRIVWDPIRKAYVAEITRATGEVIKGSMRRDGNVMVSESVQTFKDGSILSVRGVATLISPVEINVIQYFVFKDESLPSSSVVLKRQDTPSKGLVSDSTSAPSAALVGSPADYAMATLVKAIAPKYPFLERFSKPKDDTVYVEFVIGIDGTVTDALCLSKVDLGFADSAVGAVRKWTFKPATLNRAPIRSAMVVPIVFHLQK